MFSKKALLIGLMSFGVQAQDDSVANAENIIVGQRYVLNAAQMEQEQQLQISLPADYSETGRKYPVLYVLDGQWQFLEAVSFVRRLSSTGKIPDVIVVGLPRTIRDNKFYYAGSADTEKLLNFIEQTVQPFVTERFRTTGQNIITGWAYTGGFALHALVQKPHLFDAYIASSPFPVADYTTDFENTSYQFMENFPNVLPEDEFLYFGADVSEGMVIDGTRKLNDLLSEKAPSNLAWFYEELTGEEHVTTAHRILYSGLRKLFDDFGDLAFDSVADFKEQGGLEAVKAYYRNRAEKYDTRRNVEDLTVFRLARLAMDEENIELFDQLRANFDPYFSRARFSWSNRFAAFYLKHNRNRVAVKMYQRLVDRFPRSIAAYSGLGDAYAANSNIAKAKSMYGRAIDFAKDTDDERLAELQEKLRALN